MYNDLGSAIAATALQRTPLKNTRARRAILAALGEGAHHPDAETLLHLARAREPSLSLASVYRTLKELEARDLVVRHSFVPGAACWELAGGQPHDHLVDLRSGTVFDFRSDEIHQLEEAIASTFGYRLLHARLALYGVKRD
jgi:Fur family ferric uptake transcriptional regulator